MDRTKDDTIFGPITEEEQYETRQLMKKMVELATVTPASKRIVRSTKHDYQGHALTSWKCTEFLYKKDPCPLPTQARGLFTTGTDNTEIVARGYNKFFNVGEVKQTKWKWIEENTRGPYELTVKENGCLNMAAGLDDGKTLLVTSKHSTNVPHAEVGMQWMHRHLERAGKTVEEFGGFLASNNATAVFELCDDSFEEHILEYPERMRGLYLHGINRNSIDLWTWPSEEVTKVAREFGFMETKYFVFDTVEEGKAMADKVRSDHVLDGRAIEGFVVRCRMRDSERPFMFKIKYDEPYLMFREWREITNRVLSDKPYRTSYALSKLYAAWVKNQIKEHPEQFELFGKQQGIIGARTRFLEAHRSAGGTDADVFEAVGGQRSVLVVPVATIGCGKTTLALALAKLFGFGHVQNDNITVKKNARGAFHRAILNEFDSHEFVVADRNNHMPMLRQTLTEAIREELPNCRVVALQWNHDSLPSTAILQKTSGRVVARGDGHQSLTPKGTPQFRGIMQNFVREFRPIDTDSETDGLIEHVIELDPMAESSINLRTAVDALCEMFPEMLQRPTEDAIDAALNEALAFKPTVKKVVGKARDRERKPAFFGLTPVDVNIDNWLADCMAKTSDVDWSV
ncbi:trna ligase, partial [Linderina macrospora]